MNAKGQPGRVDATSSGKSRSYAIAFSSLAVCGAGERSSLPWAFT
jgi:hypothetical protein